MPRTSTSRSWSKILSAFASSGLSQAEFCRRNQLSISTFRYQRCLATRKTHPLPQQAPRLVELLAPALPVCPTPSESLGISSPIPLSDTLRIEVPTSIGRLDIHGQPDALAQLLRLLSPAHPTHKV